MTKLTPQQEAFARELAKGKNQSDAYRVAYPTSLTWKVDGLHVKASQLAADARVVLRVAELRAPALEKLKYEIEDAMREAKEAFDLAKEIENPSAMVGAVTLRSKLKGLMVEDRKNDRAPLTDDELDAEIAAESEALALIERSQKGSGKKAADKKRAKIDA